MNEISSEKKPKIHNSWLREIEEEFKKPYMENLRSFLIQEKSRGARIFPPSDQIFAAINETSLDDTKVVIIGQDPYHKVNQAHGLSFSVNPDIKIPPAASLSRGLATTPGSRRCVVILPSSPNMSKTVARAESP